MDSTMPSVSSPGSSGSSPGAPAQVVRFGRIHAHSVSFDEALDHIVALCRAGDGGYVVTPNVDHVVIAEDNAELVAAYARSALSLVDGKPLVWLAKGMGTPVPGKISGSDLARPLVARAAAAGLSVFLLGAKEGVGAKAAEILVAEHPSLKIAGVLSPPLGFEKDEGQNAAVVRTVRDSGAALVLVALGAPKQELWMARHKEVLAPAVMLGLGGTLDFIAGTVKRAPAWMSDAGLEWLYRLAQEPRRMASRYLVRDRAFVGIALRALLGRTR